MSISDIDSKTAVMGVFGSLLAYMFYGRIQDASDIQALKQEMEQVKSEQRDIWTKYNIDQEQEMLIFQKSAEFMVLDANQKADIKAEIKRVELDNTARWLDYYEKD